MDAPDIKCPYCGEQMAAGTNFIRGTFWGFMLVGFSMQHLWFSCGDKKEIILHSGEGSAGHRCIKCGVVTILPLTHKMSKQLTQNNYDIERDGDRI